MSRALRHGRWILPLVWLCAAPAAPAQVLDPHSMVFTVLGGIGGSQDADPGSGFGNQAFQLGFTLVTEPQTGIDFRVGRLDLSDEEEFGRLHDAELDYLQVGGHYMFNEGYYDSGVYLGLGGYRLDGGLADGTDESETALGGALYLLGDFTITRHIAMRVELSGHYVLFDDARLFAMGQAGLAVRF